MIVEWLAEVLARLLSNIIESLPELAVPAWVSGAETHIQAALTPVAAFSPWLPIDLVAPVLASVFGVGLLGFGLKLSRVILSLFSGGGGSAG